MREHSNAKNENNCVSWRKRYDDDDDDDALNSSDFAIFSFYRIPSCLLK